MARLLPEGARVAGSKTDLRDTFDASAGPEVADVTVTGAARPPDAGDVDTVELFDAPKANRPFSPGDVLRLLVGLGVAAIGAVVARVAQATVEGIESDLTSVFNRLPDAL